MFPAKHLIKRQNAYSQNASVPGFIATSFRQFAAAVAAATVIPPSTNYKVYPVNNFQQDAHKLHLSPLRLLFLQ